MADISNPEGPVRRDPASLRDHALERDVLKMSITSETEASFANLRKEFFDKSENLAIFQIVCDMISSNRAVAPQPLATELAQRNPRGWQGSERELANAYLAEAYELARSPVKLDFQWAITRLGQLATAREQDKIAMEILATLHGPLPDSADGRDPFAIKQELVSTHLAKLGTLASSRLAQIENLVAIVDDGKETGAVQSGFGGIDKVMSIGGIPKGQLTVVRAHHKGGKSLLMRSMFYRDITQGIRALYVTFADISKIQLKRLLIQADTGERRTPRTLDKLATYDASVKFFHDHFAPNGYIIDAFGVSEDTSIEDITEAIKNFHKEHRFDKIYLDYAQKISSRDPKARAGSIAEFDVVCRKLANFFHHLGVACVVGSQTTAANKATGDRAKTKLGRRLEEEAGLVLHVTKDMHNIEIEIVYNRWGEASVDGGSKKLVIRKLTHNYEKHIIEGEGVPEWKDGDSSEPYIPRAA